MIEVLQPSAYSYLTYGRQLIRKEQTYSGGWNDSWRATYKWDTMDRQNHEQREDYVSSTWTSRYDITQVYDKNGNRTQYHQNTASGYEADYGAGMNLSYHFNDVNALTAIADSDDSDYAATVTYDANGNITQVQDQSHQLLQELQVHRCIWRTS